MIIVGLDPGLATLGYGVIEKDARGNCRAVDCGVVLTPKEEGLPVRLALTINFQFVLRTITMVTDISSRVK